MNKFIKIAFFPAALFMVCIASGMVMAQNTAPAQAPTPAPVTAPAATVPAQSPAPAASDEGQPEEEKYFYEKPTRQKFSRLYWALDMMNLANDQQIDNFLMINECDIYKNYYYNEFEWKNVRESGRAFLKANKNTFPLRFEIAQPLYLGEYDLKTHEFEILDEYKIKNTTRIQVFPGDYTDPICQNDGSGRTVQIPDYPVGIVAELNRPLDLEKISVPEEIARDYIDQKMQAFKTIAEQRQTQENLYNFRDAYIFMQVKFFAYKDHFTDKETALDMAEIMAVLEGIQVDADRDKKMLLWSQDFRKKKRKLKPRSEEPAQPAQQPASPVVKEEEVPFEPQTPGVAKPADQQPQQ